MRILLFIRALTIGGAERQVVLFAKKARAQGHHVSIVVFYSGGELEAELDGTGILHLGKQHRWDNIGFFIRWVRVLLEERPDILYSWLPVANLLSISASVISPRARRVWALCASNMDVLRYDWLVRWTTRLEARLSFCAHVLISNSYAGKNTAISNGIPKEKLRVIPNGIDTTAFYPDLEIGKRVRSEWKITEQEYLIGLVGRLDPMKGHTDFLMAASLLSKKRTDVHFVCVGEGEETYRRELQRSSEHSGLQSVLTWAGSRTDMCAVYNALDIAVSSSLYGEGLSNMIAEAMACGIPCVVTDVGDSSWVVGDTGIVVPPGRPNELALAIETLLNRLEKQGTYLSERTRCRVEKHCSVEQFVKNTLAEMEALL